MAYLRTNFQRSFPMAFFNGIFKWHFTIWHFPIAFSNVILQRNFQWRLTMAFSMAFPSGIFQWHFAIAFSKGIFNGGLQWHFSMTFCIDVFNGMLKRNLGWHFPMAFRIILDTTCRRNCLPRQRSGGTAVRGLAASVYISFSSEACA